MSSSTNWPVEDLTTNELRNAVAVFDLLFKWDAELKFSIQAQKETLEPHSSFVDGSERGSLPDLRGKGEVRMVD